MSDTLDSAARVQLAQMRPSTPAGLSSTKEPDPIRALPTPLQTLDSRSAPKLQLVPDNTASPKVEQTRPETSEPPSPRKP
jgi:hypothetical protein